MYGVKLQNEKTELKVFLIIGLKTGNTKSKLDSLTKGFETHSGRWTLHTVGALDV